MGLVLSLYCSLDPAAGSLQFGEKLKRSFGRSDAFFTESNVLTFPAKPRTLVRKHWYYVHSFETAAILQLQIMNHFPLFLEILKVKNKENLYYRFFLACSDIFYY